MEKVILPKFGAYFSPRDFKEDVELTHVGRGTACGEYMRRFWQPVAFTQELTDLPLRVRILGEDLVLFKDGQGRLGLLEMHCSHRGASLEFGVIENSGVRCFYHGWLYGTDGSILETPAGRPLCNAGKIAHGAYPVIDYHGLVFAYMGPPDKKPAFPIFDVAQDPNITVEPGVLRTSTWECNWLQVQENGMDPAHTAFLHVLSSGTQRGFSEQMGVIPDMQFDMGDIGGYYIASRRVGENVWIRIVDTGLPNFAMIAADNQEADKAGISQWPFLVAWHVPVDDTHTKRLYLLFNDKRQPLTDHQKERAFGQANDRSYPERQRHPGDYDAMTSQGGINIHDYENISESDVGIKLFRDHIRKGIRDVAAGKDPQGVVRGQDTYVLRTRTQNTVLHVPPAPTPQADVEVLRATGRQVAQADYRRELPPC